jgi:HEAT repeat protein
LTENPFNDKSLGKKDNLGSRIDDLFISSSFEHEYNELLNSEGQNLSNYIVAKFSDPNIKTQSRAVYALGLLAQKFKDEEYINLLVNQFSNKDRAVKFVITRMLGIIGSNQAIDQLLTILSSAEDPNIKAAAAEKLGELKEERAIQPLLLLLEHEHEDLSLNASLALGEIGSPALLPLLDIIEKSAASNHRGFELAVKALGYIGSNVSTTQLLSYLHKNQSNEVKRAIIIALGRIKDNKATRFLIPLLHDDAVIRQATIEALANIKSKQATVPLLRMLETVDIDAQTKVEIIIALGEINDKKAIPILLNTLNDQNPEVRAFSIASLRAMKVVQAVSTILELLYDNSEEVRFEAAQALGDLGNLDHIPYLEKVQTYEPDNTEEGYSILVEEAAVEAIQKIKKRKR